MSSSTLDDVIAARAIRTLFQPIIDLRGPRVHCFEALSRGPLGSRLESADVLFHAARQRREERFIDRTCASVALAAARALPNDIPVALNVHALTLGLDREFVAFLIGAAHESGIGIERLVVEIVEYAPFWDGPAFLAALAALRRAGARIALDDIGIGQSNYRMILDCRPDYMKVDRYLVANAANDNSRQAVLYSISRLARDLGSVAIAEGIENDADLQTARTLGFDLVQGFLFSAPRPAADLTGPMIKASLELWGRR